MHLTSIKIGLSGKSLKIGPTISAIITSESIILPWLSTTPILSASPSYAKPISALFFLTAACNCFKFSFTFGSGWWFGNEGSDLSFIYVTLYGNLSYTFFTITDPVPFPGSTTTFKFFFPGTVDSATASAYASDTSICFKSPSPFLNLKSGFLSAS